MLINSISVKNFLSFQDSQQIDLDKPLTVIVGANDAGKTNIFRAFNFMSGILNNRTRIDFWKFANPYFHNGNYNEPIEIEVEIKLDEDEISALTSFLVCSSLLSIIDGGPKDEERELKKWFILTHGKDFFKDLFANMKIRVKAERKRNYPDTILIELHQGAQKLFIHRYGTLSREITRLTSYSSISLMQVLYEDFSKKYPNTAKKNKKTIRKILGDYKPTNVFELIFRRFSANVSDVVDMRGLNVNDIESRIESNLRLKDFTQGQEIIEFAEKFGLEGITIDDMITKMFDSSILRISNIRSIPKPKQLEEVSDRKFSLFHEIEGDDMPLILFKLKNSNDPDDRRNYRLIVTTFKKITNMEFEVLVQSEKVEKTHDIVSEIFPRELSSDRNLISGNVRLFGTRPQKFHDYEHELVIHFIKGNLVIPLYLAAAGLFEILYLLTVLIGQKKKLILLDEPASNLHPSMQTRLLELIKNNTIKKDKNRVVIISHSPYLIDTEYQDSIWRFSNSNTGTEILHIGNILHTFDTDDSKQLNRYFANPEIRSFLFARSVILVEGISDRLVLELIDKYLSSIGKGMKLQDDEIVVLPVGGKNSFRLFFSLASKLAIPYVAVVDSDALMNCERKIRYGNTEIRTSAIFDGLFGAGQLTKSEIIKLLNLQSDRNIITFRIKDNHIGYRYKENQKLIRNLQNMIAKHKVFVFIGDLEDALRSPTSKRRKPLKSVDAAIENIANHNISQEFYSLVQFVKQRLY